MAKRIFITLVFLSAIIVPIYAETVSVSSGMYFGYMPSMGGNLDSYTQQTYFNTNSGVDGINRSMSGYSTSNIDRLTGVFGGVEFKAIFYDYYLLRIGANYGMSVMGGKGKTVYEDGGTYYTLKCEYKYTEYDFPVTLGLSIPIWKDSRISLSCGTAFVSAKYENKFESNSVAAPFATQRKIKGSFSGWALPLVVIIQGDYFVSPEVALTSTISYYKGATKVIKDSSDNDGNVDFASIDFTGYRFSLGVSYYFYSK